MPNAWAMEWTTWVFAGAVVVAYAVAIWTAVRRPGRRADLPMEHVAAAALIGLVAWGSLTDVREVAAITGAPYDYLTAMGLFVIGTVIAIVGILQRRPWGIVLGIGLAATHVLGSAAALIQVAMLSAQALAPVDGSSYFEYIAPTIVMEAVPSLVAIGLLAWPLRRRPSATEGHDGKRSDSPALQPTPTDRPS